MAAPNTFSNSLQTARKKTTIAPAAPTLYLPPLGRLTSYSTEIVGQALQHLRCLYFPPASSTILNSSQLAIPKRSIRHSIHDNSVPDSGYASAEEDDDDDEIATTEFSASDSETDTETDVLRADPLERAFAIKWVTGFVTRSSHWISACESEVESEDRSEILDEATALLSSFTGWEDEEDVALTRTFSFPLTPNANFAEGTTPNQIQVELNDAPLSKDDHTSVGLQSWGSCILLADRFCLQPSFFSLTAPNGDNTLRILELGAGTGMLSIVASKLLQSSSVEIIATDYHLDVLENLSKNIETNFPFSTSQCPPILVTALDWEHPDYEAPLDRPFDVILAADVIYHPSHAQWIKRCVKQLLTRPDSTANVKGGVFWLIIPVRTTGRHEGMDATVENLFPDVSSLSSPSGDGLSEPKLVVTYREEVGRQGGVGRADEGAYKLFKIGWVN